jgi:dUTP pyrophosphatase
MVPDLSILVARVGPVDVPLPRYQSAGAAGMDLTAALEKPLRLKPRERALVPTGLRFAIPVNYEGQVRPRSGLAAKHGITTLNTPGTIDSDYRGEVKVLLINLGSKPVTIAPLDRIAQLVIAPVARAELRIADVLDETERGEGGYGSTGVS